MSERKKPTVTTDATTPMVSDADHNHSRQVRQGGRIVVLPPTGHGNLWAGGARR